MNEQVSGAVHAEQPIGPGLLVLVVGPSGAGKDTLIGLAQARCAKCSDIVFPVRTVTREASQHENNRGVTPDAFAGEAASGAFVLWWQAHGHGYGIPKAIDDDLRAGRNVVVNVSRSVIGEARARYANVKVVSITAPADVLAERLAARNRPSDGSLTARLARASDEKDLRPDVVIENTGEAEAGAARLLAVILNSEEKDSECQ